MLKKRSILTMFVVASLIIVVMFTLTPLHVSAKTTSPTADMGVVTVDLLNVRDSPSSDSNIIGRLKAGTFLTIEKIVTSPDRLYKTWLKINYYGETAYVVEEYVDFIDVSQNENTANSKVELEDCRGMITASKLNLRAEPNTSSDIITTLAQYTYIDVSEIIYTSDTVNHTWLKVHYDDFTGYVSKKYVKLLVSEPVNTTDELGSTTGYLNLRTSPTTSSTIKETLLKGSCVDVLDSVTTCDKYEKWYKVQSPNGNIGWVAGDYIQVGKWTLSSSVTTRSSSKKNRDHNIALACSFINGQMITPEKEFSWFESVLGSCSEEKGFLQATIYVNGELDQGYGGGVCQVSTTINMAIKALGIKTNAYQHSLPVSYASKEDEATVSYPWHNFSFVNTLQKPILLEMIASYGSCTCNVYVLE